MSNTTFSLLLFVAATVPVTGLLFYLKYRKSIPKRAPVPDEKPTPIDRCSKMKCGHSSCSLEDDQCGRPEHRFCSMCETVRERNEWELECDNLSERLAEARVLLGKVMDRIKGPEASLSEDLNQILRDEIQAAFESKKE